MNTYSKKIAACMFALTLAFSAGSCSKINTADSGIRPDTGTSSDTHTKVSDSKKSGKNQITVYYDEVKISDTDLTGALPLASFGDMVYYTKTPDIYGEDFEKSSYNVDITTGVVKPDTVVSEQSETDVSAYDIPGQMEELGLSNKFLYDKCTGKDGSIYLAISEKYVSHSVYTLDGNGKLKDLTGEMTDLADYVNALYTDAKGNIVLSTGYGTVLTDVIDPKTGKTLYRYENYGVESLIGPSEKYDMVYVKSDGIYGYSYENDSEEMIASEDLFPQLSSSFESAYAEGNLLHITMKNIGSPSLYEISKNTGEVIKTDCSRIDSACFSDDGTMYYASSEYHLVSDGDETYESTVCSVYRHEKDGNDTLMFVLPQYRFEARVGNIVTDSAGNFYIAYMNEDYDACIMKYDLSGNLSETLLLPEDDVFGITLMKNEKNEIFAVSGSYSGIIYKLNEARNRFEEIYSLENTYVTCFSGNSGYDFFFADQAGLYGWKQETGAAEELILWADTENSVPDYSLLRIVSPSEILLPDGKMLVKADETRLAELNSREILTLAVSGTGLVKPFVSEFNRENENYRILLRDYSKFGTSYEYNGFGPDSENLTNDIIKGDIPDLIMLDDMDLSSFIVKNGFADLKTFADSDPDFDSSDYYSCITDVFTYNDILYTIPALSSSQVFLVRESVHNQISGQMNYDTFLSTDSGNTDIFHPYSSFRGFLLERVIGSYINDHVRIDEKKCELDNEKFAALLDFIKENGRPDDEEWFETNEPYSVKSEFISDLINFDNNTKKPEWEPEKFYISGYPSENGGTRMIAPFLSFGISENSELKDGAWEFIKFMLKYDYRKSDSMNMSAGLQPTCISLSEKYITDAEELSAEYNGGITRETSDAYRSFLNMPAFSDIIYKNIKRIVREEADIFFAGERTSEETAAAIQNKVSLYLNEIS